MLKKNLKKIKVKSKSKKKIPYPRYEEWVCPLSRAASIWLCSILQTSTSILFFLRTEHDRNNNPKHDRIIVMMLKKLTPFSLSEETFAHGKMQNYNKTAEPFRIDRKHLNCFKYFGTTFITDMNGEGSIARFSQKKITDVPHCIITTVDEWIEFIPIYGIKWKSHPVDTNLEELMVQYSKGQIHKETKESPTIYLD